MCDSGITYVSNHKPQFVILEKINCNWKDEPLMFSPLLSISHLLEPTKPPPCTYCYGVCVCECIATHWHRRPSKSICTYLCFWFWVIAKWKKHSAGRKRKQLRLNNDHNKLAENHLNTPLPCPEPQSAPVKLLKWQKYMTVGVLGSFQVCTKGVQLTN